MAQRHFNLSRGSLFSTFFVASLLLLFIPQKHTSRLNIAFLKFFNPVLSIGGKVRVPLPRRVPSTEDYVSRQEYEQLTNAYRNAQAALTAMKDRYDTLAQIRSRLPQPGPALVLAAVIKTSKDGYGHEIVISRGADDGIVEGNYVLSGAIDTERSCIIGSVSQASATFSRVRLLTDPKQTMMIGVRREGGDAEIVRSMIGDGKEGCKIPLVELGKDIKKGDTVYAEPQQGLLDIPIVVGEISEVKPDEDEPYILDISVKPAQNAFELADVAVIVMTPKETQE